MNRFRNHFKLTPNNNNNHKFENNFDKSVLNEHKVSKDWLIKEKGIETGGVLLLRTLLVDTWAMHRDSGQRASELIQRLTMEL